MNVALVICFKDPHAQNQASNIETNHPGWEGRGHSQKGKRDYLTSLGSANSDFVTHRDVGRQGPWLEALPLSLEI